MLGIEGKEEKSGKKGAVEKGKVELKREMIC